MKTKPLLAVANASLFLIVSFVLLIPIEFLILPRLVDSNMSREQLLLGVLAPPGRSENGVDINSLGFAGDPMEEEAYAQGSKIRVLTLGGSTMFLRNMTNKIKAELQEAMPEREIEVLGAALPTHDSRLSVVKYEYLRKKRRFDYVLIYHGINDLWANNVPAEDFYGDYSQVTPFHYRGFLVERSLVARRLYNKYWELQRSRWAAAGRIYHEFNGANYASANAMHANLEWIVNAARADGAKPLLMTFAWHLPDDYTDEKFFANALDYHPDRSPPGCCETTRWGPVDYVAKGLRKHNTVIRKVAQELNVELVDQLDLLAGAGGYFQDICHFSEDGAILFARNVASALRDMEYVRIPK